MTLRERIGQSFLDARKLLREQPSSADSPEERAQERRRRVILSTIASAIAKVLSVAIVLITVPLTLSYLGTERYGMWMTISSLIAMLSFADLGMGNGLLNAVAHAHGRGDVRAIRSYISSGFASLSFIACCVLIGFAMVYPWVTWAKVFNAQGVLAQSESGPALATFVALFAINIPLGVVGRVQAGLQQSFRASLWQCAGSLVGLACMLAVIQLRAGLPWLVAAAFGAPALAAAFNTALYLGRSRVDLRPRYSDVSRNAVKHVARTGVLFLILQLVTAVAYASDNLVIAQLLGASAVTDYAIPEKLFSLIAMAVAMMLAPLWPAYGEALACGDMSWVRRAFGRSLLVALSVSSVLSVGLAIAAPTLLSIWVGHPVDPPFLLLIGLALWKVIEAGGNAVAMLLNGANIVRPQIIIAVLTGVCAFILKIVLVGHIGVSGAVWATIIAFCLIGIVPLAMWAVPEALKGRTPRLDSRAHA